MEALRSELAAAEASAAALPAGGSDDVDEASLPPPRLSVAQEESLEAQRSAAASAERAAADAEAAAAGAAAAAARWPSEAAREAELTRQLAAVEAQTASRRAQAQALQQEGATLAERLEALTAERRRLQAPPGAARRLQSALGAGAALRSRGGADDWRRVAQRAAQALDAAASDAGRALRRSGALRGAAVVYALTLHAAAFLVLAWRAVAAQNSR